MQTDRQSKTQSAGERAKYQNLVRYVPSGTIFTRFKIGGKQVRRSLEAKSLELAKRKHAEFARQVL